MSPAIEKSLEWLCLGSERWLSLEQHSEKAEFRRLKAICELSFITALLPKNALVNRLAQIVGVSLKEAAQNGRFLTALWHQPQHANLYLPLLYSLLHQDELSLPEQHDLSRIIKWLRLSHKERQPFRSLDFLYSCSLLTGSSVYRDEMIETASFGCLSSETEFVGFVDGDEYAVTHSVFYLSSFGAWEWPFSVDHRVATETLLEALSLEALEQNNWDLYAEYCCAHVMLRGTRTHSEISACPGISVFPLLNAQNSDGSWPGPIELKNKLKDEGFTSSGERQFYTHYHTTLVAWMALYLRIVRTEPRHFRLDTVSTDKEPISLRYPDISKDWITLHSSFDNLVSGEKPAKSPPETLADEAQGVLPWLEWHYWARLLGHQASLPFSNQTEYETLILESITEHAWRKLRTLLLGGEMGAVNIDLLRQVSHALIDDLSCISPSAITSTLAVDQLISLALLSDHVTVPPEIDSKHRQLCRLALLLAIKQRDIFALGPLSVFIGRKVEESIVSQSRKILDYALSNSMPYGFVNGGAIEQRRCLSVEFYLTQAIIYSKVW